MKKRQGGATGRKEQHSRLRRKHEWLLTTLWHRTEAGWRVSLQWGEGRGGRGYECFGIQL